MFDTTKPFIVEIVSGGIRRAIVRYPTDDEWCQRVKAQRILRHDIGRGRSTSEVTPLLQHDDALFRVLLNGSKPEADFDDYEASLVIDTLAKAEVAESASLSDAQLRVTLAVFGKVETVHLLRSPRRKEVVDYGRAAVKVTHLQRGAETKLMLEPSGRLYDELIISTEGYESTSLIPIVHKDAVIVEVCRLQNPEE